MNVEELIKKLQKIENKKAKVIMASDGEGNNYEELSDVESGPNLVYNAENKEFGFSYLTPEQKKKGYSEDGDVIKGVPAVILFP